MQHSAKRVLLLLTGLAALGGLLVANISAQVTGSDMTPPSSSLVQVSTPNGRASYQGEAFLTPANGLPHPVANINATDEDLSYQLGVDPGALSVIDQGTTAGFCGSIIPNHYSVVDFALPMAFDHNFGPPVKIGELHLTLPIDANNNCVVREAIVQVVFTALGPDVP